MDAIVGLVLGAIVAGFGTYYTTRRELLVRYDADLRELRLGAYKDLWNRLDKLAKYARPSPLTDKQAVELGKSLAQWYFEVGGLVLSTDTRNTYFRLQNGIEGIKARIDAERAATDAADPDEQSLSLAEDDFLRVLGSRLRTELTRDVGTRETFMFRPDRRALLSRKFLTGEDRDDASPPDSHRYEERDGDRSLELTPPEGRKGSWQAETVEPARAEKDGKTQIELTWSPTRSAFVSRADIGSRVFYVEDKDLVEGPEGWRRNAPVESAPPAVWVPKAEKPPS